MYVTQEDSVQRPLTSGPRVAGRPAFESVRTKISCTCVYMRRKKQWWWRKSVEVELISWPAGRPLLGKLPPQSSWWSSPMVL
jgi:hypothetical protein